MKHEQSNVSETQKAIPKLVNTGSVFKVESDGLVKIVKKMLFNDETLTAIGSLGGNGLKQVYMDAHLSNRNFNNTFKKLVIGTMALIPYEGIFISSQIGLLWPKNVDLKKNQIIKKMDQLVIRLDEKISDYDLDGLIKEVESLMKILQSFENVVNSRLYLEDKGNVQGDSCIVIKCINDSFIKVIDWTQKDLSKAGKLPIFTIIATAHLQFLYFVEKNRRIFKLQLDTERLNECFMKDFKKTTEEYVSYIHKTHQMGIQKFIEKMKNIAKYEVGNYSLDDQENLSEMRKYYQKIFVHESTALSPTAKRKVVNLAIAINEYENLMIEKNIYYDDTWGNKAFLQVAKVQV